MTSTNLATVRVEDFPPDVAAAVQQVTEHLNDEHPDTIGLLTSLAPPRSGAAAFVRVDPGGVDVRASDGRLIQLRFTSGKTGLDDVQSALLSLLAKARQQVGDAEPLTSYETEMARSKELRTYVTQVSAVRPLTQGMLELTLRGGIDALVPAEADQFLYLMTNGPGGAPIERGFTLSNLQTAPQNARPPAATYTIRRLRPDVGELDLWIALHDHEASVATWARTVSPGHTVAIWGPRGRFRPPKDTVRLLLVGDETALPTIGAILDDLAQNVKARVIIEAAHPDHVLDLPSGHHIVVDWVFRSGGAAGTGAHLLDAVRALDLDPSGLYCFGGSETRQIAAVRRHLRQDRGLASRQVRMSAYWRRGG